MATATATGEVPANESAAMSNSMEETQQDAMDMSEGADDSPPPRLMITKMVCFLEAVFRAFPVAASLSLAGPYALKLCVDSLFLFLSFGRN